MDTAEAVRTSAETGVLPQLFAEDLKAGMTHTVEVPVTRGMIISYADVIDDHMIGHMREGRRCFAHGRLLGDLAAAAISNWLGGTEHRFPVLTADSANYVGMVPAGSTFKITFSIRKLLPHSTSRLKVFFDITGFCDGKEVVAATANALVPYRNRG